jgi:hypothetical protein
MKIPSATRVRELLLYDPETGHFTWRISRKGTKGVGKRAGVATGPKSHQVVSIGIDYSRLIAHRLAWLYMTGEWPTLTIDHINHNQLDNRWCNLRLATQTQNNANTPLRRHNTSGFKGVSWHKKSGRWRASLTFRRKHYHLGFFSDPKNAYVAYCAKARELHGEFFCAG